MPALGDAVRASRSSGVLLIQLQNATGYPRLTRAILEELHRQVDALESMPDVHAAVVTGTEHCFAAGADLSEVGVLRAIEALHFSALGQTLLHKIEQHSKSIVAAIRGYCLGGGLDLALACRLRVAARDSVLGHPGTTLGIITGWGGTARLPRLMGPGGRARAKELLVSGRTITAEEAYAFGLVNRLSAPEQVVSAAIHMARSAALRRWG